MADGTKQINCDEAIYTTMKNIFDDNEFEQFLQDETKQHRMYPSDKIWRNIHKELHVKKSWPALNLLALFIISALTVSTIINNHPAQPFFKAKQIILVENKTITNEKTVAEYRERFSSNSITSKTFAVLKEKANQQEMMDYEIFVAAMDPLVASVPDIAKAEVLLYEPHIVDEFKAAQTIDQSLISNNKKVEKEIKSRLNKDLSNSSGPEKNTAIITGISSNPEIIGTNKNGKINIAAALEKSRKNNFFKKPVDDNPSAADFENNFSFQKQAVTVKPKTSQFDIQFYIAPSISYRKLVDDKERNNYQQRTSATVGPRALNYSVNVNDVVRHKPAMGTEVGFGLMYKLSERLKLKTGLQFNVRQYYIDGFSSNGDLATIAIMSNNRLDTVTQFSNFSNTNGYKESQLDNKLYQISMPIGLQWDFIQQKRLGFNIAASIQPTVTLNKDLYIISTDYKFYTDGTPFIRRWNVNSSAELNITYKVGNVKWALGPQIRYQHLPTYTERYPIKEYRLDYGLKIGVTKSF